MGYTSARNNVRRVGRRPVWIEALRLFGALVISLLLWEGILRLTVGAPAPFVQHPRLGWTPKPFATGFNGREGWSRSTYNELGFRDARIDPKPPGELRILCLGDSYTEGGGMAAARTFPKLLERSLGSPERLARLPGRPTSVRVINAGRAGTTMAYSVGLAETYQELVDPDWVVLQVRDYGEVLFDPIHEFRFVRAGADISFRNSWHQENVGAVKRALVSLGLRESAVCKFGLQRAKDFLRAASRQPTRDSAPKAQQPSSQTLRAVDWCVSQLRARYPRLVVVHIPYGSAASAALTSPQAEETRLVEDCKSNNVPVIPMRRWIERDYAVTRVPPFGFSNTLPWSGHPNEHGNALVANALLRFFDQVEATDNQKAAPESDE
ncbi:MAG: SGNH/GDSL hydrolase family protein [Actinomycetota bacterium]